MNEILDPLEDNNKNFRKIDVEKFYKNIGNVLDYKFPKIIIKHIPENINIEHTIPFYKLIIAYKNFCKETGATSWTFDVMDVLESQSNFRCFYDFVFANSLAGNIVVENMDVGKFVSKLRDLQWRHNQNLKSIDKYYDEIVEKIHHPKGYHKKDEHVKKDMYMFMSAYTLMKQAFDGIEREAEAEDWKKERYFSHLIGVMEIILRELPNPNIRRIVISLLHDVVEDIPEYTMDILKAIYGEYIAKWVACLSKRDWKEYLTKEELKWLDGLEWNEREQLKKIWKERRDEDYFGHLDELNDDYLACKVADRLHNLRTLQWLPEEKVKRKIKETEKYFVHVTKERMPVAYELLAKEIKILKDWLK